MEEIQKRLGIRIPRVLLPSENVDYSKWAVIACDQYTSQLDYWNEVIDIVNDAPSTLHMIYPEIFLGEECPQKRIDSISANIEKYLSDGTLVELPPGVIVTIRSDQQGKVIRKGVMLNVDLECYDYSVGSTALIRATEGTIKDRIPPRLRVRAEAAVEVPHVMMLINDESKSIIEPIINSVEGLKPIYDTELMMGGGSVKGWLVRQPYDITRLFSSMETLIMESLNSGNNYPVLFAVGDGNHSLATAKAHWDNIKKNLDEEQIRNHPARFALCEIVNLYDDCIKLEPIHRLIFNVDPEKYFKEIIKYFNDTNQSVSVMVGNNKISYGQAFQFFYGDESFVINVKAPKRDIATDTIQAAIMAVADSFDDVVIDYIHGQDALEELAKGTNRIGILLPEFEKCTIFDTVEKGKVLPRKAFSIGEAYEKRYYMECKRIKP